MSYDWCRCFGGGEEAVWWLEATVCMMFSCQNGPRANGPRDVSRQGGQRPLRPRQPHVDSCRETWYITLGLVSKTPHSFTHILVLPRSLWNPPG